MSVTTRKNSSMSNKKYYLKNSLNSKILLQLNKTNDKNQLKFTIKKSEFNYRDMYPELIVNLKQK